MLKGTNPGSSFKLTGTSAPAGSSKGILLFPDDPFVGPLHATFLVKDGKLFVRDEGSPSGTFARLRAPEPLLPGSMFAAGDRLIRYVGLLPAAAPSAPQAYGAPAQSATLHTVEDLYEGGRPGRAVVRIGPVIAIGRAGCDLNFPQDPSLSPRHCEIVVEAAGAMLRDVSGQEGTFIRLPPGGERALGVGDCVRIGQQILRVEEG